MPRINTYYSYQNDLVLTAAAPAASYRVQFKEDYYLFDMGGVPTVAAAQNVNLDLLNVTRGERLTSQPCRAGLCSVMQPGDSAWLHPVLFMKNEVFEVNATLAAGAPNATIHHCLVGYHHAGGLPEWCAEPKELFFYVFDFGNFLANQTLIRSVQIYRNRTFKLLGWNATGNASALNTIEYKIRSVGSSDEWQNDWCPGASLFPNFAANMRRYWLPLDMDLNQNERIEIEARDVSGGAVLDVALVFFGYHERMTGFAYPGRGAV